MLEEYQDLVLATYKEMRDKGKISLSLLNPTPGKLKRECLKIYSSSRFISMDEDILSLFFDVDKIDSNFRQIISEADPDIFRPLLNHINEKTAKTDEKNSELLAWLIDFKPRPSGAYYKSLREGNKLIKAPLHDVEEKEVLTEENNELDKTDGLDVIEEEKESITPVGLNSSEPIEKAEEQKEEEQSVATQIVQLFEEPSLVSRFTARFIIISCIVLLLMGSSSFYAWENWQTSVRNPETNEKCMYWKDDHYEPTTCDAQIANATIIPLDLKALKQQRKITLPDTLTRHSLGKVWYKGYGSNHEYFTAAGTYPTDTARVLKPLSLNILTKYSSNYRYLLTRLVWFLCAVVFVTICGIWASKMKKKPKLNLAQPQGKAAVESLSMESVGSLVTEVRSY